MIAGPSEILVIADESANPEYVAADLLSQAEHDALASSLLVTTSHVLAREVNRIIDIRLNSLLRKDVAKASIEGY
ncbi:MAG: histidinol dehydrogenase, partial [Pseudomonadota bacterium]